MVRFRSAARVFRPLGIVKNREGCSLSRRTPTSVSPSIPATLLFAVAAALWLLFAYNVSALPLTDPDEGRYAVISREMLQTRDWLIPRLFGLPYLEKPPLLYWLTAASFEMFGNNDFAARFAPSIAATIGVDRHGPVRQQRLRISCGLAG